LRFETIITLRAACLRAWHLFRALPDAPEAAFEADLKREGQSWSGPTSQDLDPSCATTREAQVRLRVGQSTFRAALDDYWGGRCPLTGITDRAMLRASHIVPWAECKSDGQRLDVFNGLLLAAHWDAAFDAFLVSFDDEGRVLASPKLSEAGSRALGLTTAPPITLAQDHAAPLAWHRARMDEIAIRR
jgi:predicted restriction endonuclease